MNMVLLINHRSISMCLFKNFSRSLKVGTWNYQKDCLLSPPSSVHVKFVRTQVMSSQDLSCDCANFTSPCLSLSKIVLFLHLLFVDGEERVPLDVDVSPPSFAMNQAHWYNGRPLPQFDGSNVDKRENPEATRPYLWYPEWEKTEDMSDAAYEGDGLRRAVRLRNYNGVDVLAEQVKLLWMWII